MTYDFVKALHTPGPWHRNIPPASKYSIIYSGRNIHVAAVKRDGLSPEEIEANANLIAGAPRLLRALETILGVAECEPAMVDNYGPELIWARKVVGWAKFGA